MELSKVLAIIIVFFAVLFFTYFTIGNILTFRTKNMPEQSEFMQGKVPNPLPNGSSKGTADGQGSWIGKTFYADTGTGINNFNNNGNISNQFPFKTYIGKGITDPTIDVLKIDYNIPENPIYLRFILDEIVEVAPGKYLGKVHLKLIPFVPITLEYFRLEK